MKSKQGIRFITFDCYGTLIDWESGLLAALQSLDQRFHTSFSDEKLLLAYIKAELQLINGLYKSYRLVQIEALKLIAQQTGWTIDPVDQDIIARGLPRWKAFDDVTESLTTLKQSAELAILSNTDQEGIAASLKRINVPIKHVYTAAQIGSYKPDLKNFKYLRAHLGVKNENILHVAQSKYHDIGPAKAMGWKTVWINRPSRLKNQGITPPSDHEPDFTFNSLAEFTAWWQELPENND